MASQYTVRKVGAANTLEHRIYIEKDGVPVSPFHDIPLYANEQQTVLNMVVEIPRWTNGKLEVCGQIYPHSIYPSFDPAPRISLTFFAIADLEGGCLEPNKDVDLPPHIVHLLTGRAEQDIKKGKLRFVRNCFPHKGYLWNYGAFPQVRCL